MKISPLKVSVIIPTYNYGRYIRQAIESVLNQDYPRKYTEIIVIDDGSTDGTKERLEQLIAGGEIRYHYQANAGKAVATQKAIELATGDIIFNLDADDYFLPGKIKNSITLFNTDPGLVHVASAAMIHWEDGSRADKAEPIPSYLLADRLNGPATLRHFMENKLLFGGGSTFAGRAWALKKIKWLAEIDMFTDEWLVINMLLQGSSYLLPEAMSVWRVHGNNFSSETSPGSLLQKQQRLERSSEAILQLLQQEAYPRWLRKAYQLKHEVRKMVWLEERDGKSVADILRFLRKGVFSGNSIGVLKRYHAFNRLAPVWLRRKVSAGRAGIITPVPNS